MKGFENIIMETIKCKRSEANFIANDICDNHLESAKDQILCFGKFDSDNIFNKMKVADTLINLISILWGEDNNSEKFAVCISCGDKERYVTYCKYGNIFFDDKIENARFFKTEIEAEDYLDNIDFDGWVVKVGE